MLLPTQGTEGDRSGELGHLPTTGKRWVVKMPWSLDLLSCWALGVAEALPGDLAELTFLPYFQSQIPLLL